MKRKTNIYFPLIIVIIFLLVKGFSWVKKQNLGNESFRNISKLILTKNAGWVAGTLLKKK